MKCQRCYISFCFVFPGNCDGTLSSAKKDSSVSCETLSVFDGITVKIEYISSEEESKNGDFANSKELLLGLEERKKVAASVTTVPLRQPLSANYKSVITTAPDRTNSFSGKEWSFMIKNCLPRKTYRHI